MTAVGPRSSNRYQARRDPVSKSIAVFGAGPGLGGAVARRYASDGYAVVLVARRPEPLEKTVKELTASGAAAHAIAADLSDTSCVAGLASQIRARVGELDAIYYGPTPGGSVRPTAEAPVRVAELTPQHLEAYMPTVLYTLVALIGEFLPRMLERQSGALLTAAGGSAVRGVPYFSGPGAALAAQRNYLQSLETELDGSGIFVGRLYIGATIKNSDWHKRIQEQQAAGEPTRAGDSIVDPDDLANLLWNMHHTTKQPEASCPEEVFERQRSA
jgi:NADP-dependent 3-hydroxy acid dehydrogenase YdfG